MKASAKDNVSGKIHRMKGKIKEIIGKIVMKPDLEAEGKEEGRTGKVQERSARSRRSLESNCRLFLYFYERILVAFERR